MPSPDTFKVKFTHFTTAHVRRFTFPNPPTWSALAARIEALYAIPADKVGVCYQDPDDDEITMSSEEELKDFYQDSYHPGELVRFEVLELSQLHGTRKESLPRTPPTAHSRNTFGIQEGLMFELDDWQPLPPQPLSTIHIEDIFDGETPGSDSPHAFVEVLDSDASTVTKEQPPASPSEDVRSIANSDNDKSNITVDKGKGRAISIQDIPSTESLVIGSDTEKHPIHVYSVSAQGEAVNEVPKSSLTGEESTPRLQKSAFVPSTKEEFTSDPQDGASDPPLPSFDSASSPITSLSNDVASLFMTVNNVISAHPELSERFLNLFSNVANGKYWAGHRDALSRAANEVKQAVGETQSAGNEEEAGKRVAEALAGIFRTFTNLPSNGVEGSSSTTGEAQPPSAGAPSFAPMPPGSYTAPPGSLPGQTPWLRGLGANTSHLPWWNTAPRDRTVPRGPPHPRRPWHLFGTPPPPMAHPIHMHPHSGHAPHPTYQHPHGLRSAHRPPPPPPHGPPSIPPPPSQLFSHSQPPAHGVPPPPPPALTQYVDASFISPEHPVTSSAHEISSSNTDPSGVAPINATSTSGNESAPHPPAVPPPPALQDSLGAQNAHTSPFDSQPRFGSRVPHQDSSWAHRGSVQSGPITSLKQPQSQQPNTVGDDHKPSPQALRAQVEAAKLLYKAEKERYRKEREARRKEKESERKATLTRKVGNTGEPVAPEAGPSNLTSNESPVVTQIVSNARGPFPELEMYSVPRRHNTHPGHGLRRVNDKNEKKSEDLTSRGLARISKRLADMGFTEKGHPNLLTKIKMHMPVSGGMTREEEDNVVTILLEELLAMSPKPVPVSSFIQRETDTIPGSWQ